MLLKLLLLFTSTLKTAARFYLENNGYLLKQKAGYATKKISLSVKTVLSSPFNFWWYSRLSAVNSFNMHRWFTKFKSFSMKAKNWQLDLMPSTMLSLKVKPRKAQKKLAAFLFDIQHLKPNRQSELLILNHKMTTKWKMSIWLHSNKIPQYCLVVKKYFKKNVITNLN